MRTLQHGMLFVVGLGCAILTVSGVRMIPGTAGYVSLVVIGLTFVLFFLGAERAFPFAAGAGIGLDLLGSYAFGTHTVSLIATTALLAWLSRAYITNRSLVAILLTAVTVRTLYFSLAFVCGVAASLVDRGMAPRLVVSDAGYVVKALVSELILLWIIWVLHVRTRGRNRAIRLTIDAYDTIRR